MILFLFKKLKCFVIFVFILTIFNLNVNLCFCYPIAFTGLAVPPPEILKFMRKFGYLDATSSESEALYHETAIIEAIINVQKFGALEQTGILDSTTLKLMISPRCGVPDIDTQKSRTKRYVIGAKRWKKRKITYFIANWSNKVGEPNVIRDMTKAFQLWSSYSNLKFKRVYDPSADIIVAFGARYHGDNYPFDGPGNILAHAFYPYEMESYGGDIHFDEDENWKENSTSLADGVDFFSVAVHELGHSLGLAHSPVYSSIMFPYYKGPGSSNLDFDDILAMYHLYINGRLEDEPIEENDFDENEYPTYDSPISTTTEMNFQTTTYVTTFVGDFETVDEHQRKNGWITSPPRIPVQTTLKPKENNPSICDGNFDAISVFRGDLYIFKNEYVWRLSNNYQIINGYPININQLFTFLPDYVKNIDAVYERSTDNAIIIFSGRQVWVFNGHVLIENSPKDLSYFGISDNITNIEAAMLWPKNGRTYLFAGNVFWRFDEETQLLDNDYPKNMNRWQGIPESIDAAVTLPNGRTTFFKGNLYWLYNNKWIRPERGYPKRSSTLWFGCPLIQSFQ